MLEHSNCVIHVQEPDAAEPSSPDSWDVATQLSLLDPLLTAPPADLTEQVSYPAASLL